MQDAEFKVDSVLETTGEPLNYYPSWIKRLY